MRAEQGGTQAEHHPDRQFVGLSAGHGRVGDHLFANDHQLAGLFNEQGQRVVHQMPVMHQHLQRITQRSLVAEQQADHAEVRELARLGHAQAEALAAAGGGRILQQAHGGIDGNAMLRGLQLGFAQADAGQYIPWVEPQVLGDFQVVGQDGGANKLGHAKVFPGPVANRISVATIASTSAIEQL
ncbi:hypothetical protein PS685_05069 [Pseudomonas fluorescens]|uniref:Uncharacterized protein n=1 Tax=Pseudomonas fluorescens TaxID=294 RepID=A0A5E6ZYL9_PSEFL|nr:hypothetical protein PS685_05069 [Pseudomonas fluorescens]